MATLLSEDEATELLQRFLSCLAWEQNRPLRVVARGIDIMLRACPQPEAPLQLFVGSLEPTVDLKHAHEDVALALASFRLGMSALFPFESVVHYFRVLELMTGLQNSALEPWFKENLPRLLDPTARGLYDGLRADRRAGLPASLINKFRHPVVHGRRPPLADLESIKFSDELSEVLPILRGLASLAIATRLGRKPDGSALAI